MNTIKMILLTLAFYTSLANPLLATEKVKMYCFYEAKRVSLTLVLGSFGGGYITGKCEIDSEDPSVFSFIVPSVSLGYGPGLGITYDFIFDHKVLKAWVDPDYTKPLNVTTAIAKGIIANNTDYLGIGIGISAQRTRNLPLSVFTYNYSNSSSAIQSLHMSEGYGYINKYSAF